MRVFGKDLFAKKKTAELYDFAQHGLITSSSTGQFTITAEPVTWTSGTNLTLSGSGSPDAGKKSTPPKKEHTITPKELYQLQALNTPDLALNCEREYVEREASLLDRKAKLIHVKESRYEGGGKIMYGKLELESLAERLRNRLSYDKYREYFEQFPYTTSDTIEKVLDKHDHLKSCRVEEFIPDLPQEAIDTIDAYRTKVMELCGKRPVFYIIADKKDFTKQYKKRDPILLAQSPFGLIWQICGAWDEEMILLEEL